MHSVPIPIVLISLCLKFSLAFSGSTNTDIGNSLDVDILKYGIGCRLTWIPLQNGQPLPNSTVYLTDSKFPGIIQNSVVARTKILGRHVVGDLRPDGYAYFYSQKEGNILKKSKYEVLTNPNDCTWNWVYLSNESNQSIANPGPYVKAGSNSFSYIGRLVDSPNQLQMCDMLFGNTPKCLTSQSHSFPDGKVDMEDFQILQSVTKRLSFTLHNISFEEKAETLETTFNGQDTIMNKADVDVSSTVSYGISKSQGFNVDLSLTATAGVAQNSISGTIGGGIDRDTNEDLDVSRDINVPPLTSVEACSSQTVPGLQITFQANVTFFAEGVDAETIKRILINDNYPGPFTTNIDGNSIKTLVRGEVTGVVGQFTSEFRLNPIHVLDGMSCSGLRKRVEMDKITKVKDRLNSLPANAIVSQSHLNAIIAKAYGDYGGRPLL